MLNPDFRDILSAFNAERVEYLVVGAYALAAHGLPRATGDIDLFVRPSTENAERVWAALAQFGAPLDGITHDDLATPGTIFQIGIAPSRIDVMTAIDGVTFDVAWSGRIDLQIESIDLTVIGRSELLANKRASGRPQDLADVARLEELDG